MDIYEERYFDQQLVVTEYCDALRAARLAHGVLAPLDEMCDSVLRLVEAEAALFALVDGDD